uniref:Uncharacterized protein n=1 Tax=Canis lupus dingo TaxID=286419 RepID=A0A8C0L471_CANLU
RKGKKREERAANSKRLLMIENKLRASPTWGLTAPEPRLPTGFRYWTSKRDGEVALRQEDAFTSQPPVTVHDMVMNTAIKYANCIALGSKHRNGWHLLTYVEYYEECRRAAKAFLKRLLCWHLVHQLPKGLPGHR